MDWNKVPGIMAKRKSKDFRGLNLRNVRFTNEDLHGVDFSGANCEYTRFYKCNLNDVNFSNCNLKHVIFNQCGLLNATFENAILYNASMYYCSMNYVVPNSYFREYEESESYIPDFIYNNDCKWRAHFYCVGRDDQGICFDVYDFNKIIYNQDAIIGYKICGNISGKNMAAYEYCTKLKYRMAVLKIDENIPRVLVENGKCRAAKAKVLDIYDLNGNHYNEAYSCFLPYWDLNCSCDWLNYRVGQTVTADSFNPAPYVECTHGIHFFMSEQEAWIFAR